MVSAYPVAYTKVCRRPEKVTLNQAFEYVKQESKGAVVDSGDGPVEGGFEGGDDETEAGRRGAYSVDALGRIQLSSPRPERRSRAPVDLRKPRLFGEFFVPSSRRNDCTALNELDSGEANPRQQNSNPRRRNS
jgi:hypothetical protein